MDKNKALAIIEAITGVMKPGTQKDALESVAEYIQMVDHSDILKMTREEREARILELLTEERDSMSIEERKVWAAFYLEGVNGL